MGWLAVVQVVAARSVKALKDALDERGWLDQVRRPTLIYPQTLPQWVTQFCMLSESANI
jgi:hypothetical protein